MGTIKQGILGGFSGKVGNVVGSIWKGICTMRGLASSVTNPRTPAQLEQRAKFSTIVKFLQTMTAFIRIGFRSQANKMTAFNAAFKYNINNAITGIYPGYVIDYSKALISRGNLAGALNPEVVSTTVGEVDFTWDNNSTADNASATDLAMLLIYNPERSLSVTITGGNTRQSGSQTFALPDTFQGEQVQCYIAFQNASQSEVSNSQHVGAIIVA